jgi:allantoin racemase
MAVKMSRIMGGRFTSKKCSYAPPPPDQIETFRKFYGAEIYPTVAQTSPASRERSPRSGG